MKRFLILVGLAVLLLPSCNDDNPVWLERIPIFRVLGPDGTETAEVSISGRAQAVEFTVISTEAWSAAIEGNDDYRINPSVGGSGRTVVTLNTSANESGATRNVLLTFATDEGITADFSIAQEVQQPYLDIDTESVSVFGFGEEFTVNIETNQENWTWTFETPGAESWISMTESSAAAITFEAAANDTGLDRSAMITFSSVTNPEVFTTLTVSQGAMAEVPTDLILDVVFGEDGMAADQSPLNMTVDNSRRNSDMSVKYLEQFGCYAACFNNQSIARSNLTDGYYLIPYTTDSEFAQKIADGCTIEVVFCTYYDPLTWFGEHSSRQIVKPFSSTQAGGLDICIRAGTGQIQCECHVGGSWKNPCSSVVPVANTYYHAIGVYDKAGGSVSIYVNGRLEASQNASGDFKFMDTSVNARWFGIGADASNQDKGEASFCGEVVIARLYDSPMTEAQVASRYHEIMQ